MYINHFKAVSLQLPLGTPFWRKRLAHWKRTTSEDSPSGGMGLAYEFTLIVLTFLQQDVSAVLVPNQTLLNVSTYYLISAV